MQNALNILSTLLDWMRNTKLIDINIGTVSASITFMQCLIGVAVANIGIFFIRKVFDW